MKPYRTTLLEDASSGSVRASAALRERLSQTRARIARAHVANPLQIDVDWDPDEPPTRVYQGQPLLSPRALARGVVHREEETNPLTAYAYEQFRARVTQRPARAHHARVECAPAAPSPRPLPREVSVTQRPTAQLPIPAQVAPRASLPVPVPVVQEQHQTLPPLASRMLREATLMGERIGKLYEGLDRSDAALRRRVVYCSLALLVIAASSRMLFGGHSGAASEPPAAAKQTAAPLSANVAISSDPPGAQIILNGRVSSHVTPAKLTDLAPGRHMIGLKLAGYAEAKEALHVPGDALVSIKLAALDEPRFLPAKTEERATLTRAEQRAHTRELARERRAAARAAKVLLRYRARMGLPPDPVAQELVEAYGPTQSAE
jgi:hypothetical protein